MAADCSTHALHLNLAGLTCADCRAQAGDGGQLAADGVGVLLAAARLPRGGDGGVSAAAVGESAWRMELALCWSCTGRTSVNVRDGPLLCGVALNPVLWSHPRALTAMASSAALWQGSQKCGVTAHRCGCGARPSPTMMLKTCCVAVYRYGCGGRCRCRPPSWRWWPPRRQRPAPPALAAAAPPTWCASATESLEASSHVTWSVCKHLVL